MNSEEIKRASLRKLALRLYEIDMLLDKDNSMLISEYNEIIEEICNIRANLENKKIRSKNKNE